MILIFNYFFLKSRKHLSGSVSSLWTDPDALFNFKNNFFVKWPAPIFIWLTNTLIYHYANLSLFEIINKAHPKLTINKPHPKLIIYHTHPKLLHKIHVHTNSCSYKFMFIQIRITHPKMLHFFSALSHLPKIGPTLGESRSSVVPYI